MRDDPLFMVMAAAMLVVVAILLFGIGSFAKGGEFNKKYANKAMRWRIIAQFVAVVLIVLFVLIRRGG
ncbi:twin transmembrane helix small protein [Salipiger abyssi]|uniref:Hypoxia induced protein conserved region n=1 Tax=Salipiger abyssi TaxID=1250539 RepID=A0A1P8UV76_9RHOB|nr:twin transmembrane helix small protein [Salipiger abyssi]APZ53282.1 Hypoxia induced protein conserved region [Salipiger abyssi]MBN9888608.1 twin transmembrane helix small protein [Salipiger abyssi]